jgi:hypothetical protein
MPQLRPAPAPAAPVYRYSYGQTVVHILPPAGPGERPGDFVLVSPLCPSRRTLYRSWGVFSESFARSSRVCKACEAAWRTATGAPPAPKRKAPSTRDMQKSRLYCAEGLGLKPGRSFVSESGALSYARALLASDWFVHRFGTVTLREVRFSTGYGAYAYTGRSLITLGYGHRNERSLLHEIAHHVVHRSYAGDVPAHGPLFARVNLALVQHKLGVAEAGRLLDAYQDQRVKLASPLLLARPGARPTAWRTLIHEGRVPA